MRQIFVLLPDQVPQQPPFDVVDVLDALGEIAVRHLQRRCWRNRRMTTLTAYSAVVCCCCDFREDLLEQRFVVEHAEVEIEDVADLLAVRCGDVIAQLRDSSAVLCVDARSRGARPRAGTWSGLDLPLGNEQILGVQHDRRADHHAGRNAYALFDLH